MKISLCLPVAIKAGDAVRARMLVACLESIRAQTHTDYEVIIKDAFPAESIKLHSNVVRIMDKMRPHINYVSMVDKGIFSGLNQAMWWATGDILHMICGDDLMGDSITLDYVNHLFSDCCMPGGSSAPQWLYGSLGTVLEDGSEGHWGVTPWATLEETLVHNRMGCPATYWNRAMFEKIGYFEYQMAGDYDYWCRCYRVCPPMYTERVLAVGRRWPQSASHVNKDLTEREAAEISAKHTLFHLQGGIPVYVPYCP